jgi:hypothetical protein
MVDIWSKRKHPECSYSDRMEFCGIITHDRLHGVQGQRGVGLCGEGILSCLTQLKKIKYLHAVLAGLSAYIPCLT